MILGPGLRAEGIRHGKRRHDFRHWDRHGRGWLLRGRTDSAILGDSNVMDGRLTESRISPLEIPIFGRKRNNLPSHPRSIETKFRAAR
jgi:hypothetical protein